MPNQTRPELEQKIVQMTERYPTASYLRISPQLRLMGVGVSASAVRYFWQRHGLSLRYQRGVVAGARGGRTRGRADRSADVASTMMAVLLLAASTLTLPRYYALPKKQDFSGAPDYVEVQRRPGEMVVAVGVAGMAYSRYFAPHWLVAQTQAELDAVRRDHPAVWLVYTIPIQLKALNPEFWRMIEEEFEIVKVFPGTLGGGEIYVCRARPGKNPLRATATYFLQNVGRDVRGSRKP